MPAPARLRILLVGASGTLGRAVGAELGTRHEIVAAGRSSGELSIDITDPASIAGALAQGGRFDAVACAAGAVTFAPLAEFKTAPIETSLFDTGLRSKLMGQVNLALAARDHLSDGGSITLITGILTTEPIRAGVSASLVNGAIEAFVRAASIELPRGIRINAVSPGVLTESMENYGPFFRGFEPVPAARAALGYARSIEGAETGRVYRFG